MVRSEKWDLIERGDRFGIIVLIFVAFGMILSDCFQYFGAWVISLKYVALGAMALYLVGISAKGKVSGLRIALAMVALAVLVGECIFQDVQMQAVGLYCLVALFAALGNLSFRSSNVFYYCGIACTLLVAFLLLLSYSECVSQMAFYLATGRPRLKGCFSNANSLGHISAVIFSILMVARLRACEKRSEKRSVGFSLVLCVIYVLLSGSRTALASMAVFTLVVLYFSIEGRLRTGNARILGRMSVLLVIVVALSLSFQGIYNDYILSGRAIGWNNLGSIESLFGYGYASSSNVSAITSIAGGNVEMLWMSAYYRVGIVGMLAYALMFLAATRGSNKKDFLLFSFSLLLLVQSLGESYLTSVMSFPSLFEWLILGSLSTLRNPLDNKECEAELRKDRSAR